jgi:hypothetical protein
MADVNRAKKAATTEAMRRMIYLMLYVLIDKHQAPREDIRQFAEEINYYADSVKNRYITWKDIEHVVKEEYEVYLPW